MADILRLALARIERAKVQRRDLERDMRLWAENGAYGVASQPDPQTGQTLFYLQEVKPLTSLSEALIGEIIHALRTALDHLAYQLFLLSRTDPSDEGDIIKFPIYDDSKTTEANAFGPVKTLRPEFIEAIRKINPSKSGNPLLWALHRLDIVDKHRRILTSFLCHHSLYIGEAMKQLLVKEGLADMSAFIGLRKLFLTSPRTGRRAQVGDVLFRGMPGDEEVNKHLKFTFDITFDEPKIIEDKSVIETLDVMIKSVENLITSFAPFLV
jgi:hypothetical protein